MTRGMMLISHHVSTAGRLHMPPSGVHDIPLSSESVDAALQLLPHPLLDNLPKVLPHEVCISIDNRPFVFVCV